MSKLITQNDLTGILNEVLPSPMMIKTVQYTSTITWSSTSNPFGDVYTDIEIDGWTPINLSYLVGGSYSSFVFGSQIEIKESNGTTYAHGYFRMTGANPSSTTQNSVIWTVVYIKNVPMTLPIADYIVEQGTSDGWTYRKWNSGIAECWCNISESFAMTNALGSVYYGQKSYSISSLGFNAIGDIQVTGNCAAYYVTTKVESYSTTSLTLTALSSASRTDTIKHFIKIVGTWK